MTAWFAEVQARILEWGPAAPLAFVLLYAMGTVLLIPGSALTFAVGGLFGFKVGLATALAGANAGALASFLLARTLLRRRVEAWAASRPRFSALDRAVALDGFKVVLLTRLSPIFPFGLLNYFLGLTAVRTPAYVAASLIGMVPGISFLSYLGAVAASAATGQAGGWKLAIQILGLGATLLLIFFLTRLVRVSSPLAGERFDLAHRPEPVEGGKGEGNPP